MDRIWQANPGVTPPPAPQAAPGGYPQASGVGRATVVGPWWFHAITQELMSAITAAGITPDAEALDQLDAAIQARAAAAAAEVQDALDAFSEKVGVWPRNTRVALLGDSTVQQGISNITDETRNANRGGTHWIGFLTSQRFTSPQSLNFGVSGNTSEQMFARVGDVIASGAGVCVVSGPTNDIGGTTLGGTPFTPTITMGFMSAIYEKLANANILIVALPILPRTLSEEANFSYPQRVNAEIAKQDRGYPGFRFINPYVFGDQYSATFSPRAGYTYDGLHPMAIGSFTVHFPIAEHLNTLVPYPGPAVHSICDYYNASNLRGCLNLNSLFGGTDGTLGSGVTGQVADNYRVQAFANGGDISSMTVTCSKGTSARTSGVNQRIVIGGSATGGFDTCVVLDVPVTVANCGAGDTLEVVADVEIAGATIGVSGVEAYLTAQINGTYKWARDGYPVVSDDYVWRDVPEARFSTPPLTLSGTVGNVLFGIKIYLKNTGTTRSIDLRVNNIAVRKVL